MTPHPLPRFARTVPAVAFLLAMVTAGAAPQELNAQRPREGSDPLWVGTMWDDYLRTIQLTGGAPLSSRMIRGLVRYDEGVQYADSGNIWSLRQSPGLHTPAPGLTVRMYDPTAYAAYNNAIPLGTNDGAVWAGRGLSGFTQFGTEIRYGPLTLRLAPQLVYAANLDFEIDTARHPGVPAYADPYRPRNIDRPQRPGEDPLQRIDLGHSVIRLDWRGVALGYSNENMWWGPGIQNALLLTNNAPGFRHAFLGTSRPVNVWIGNLEAMWMSGRLEDSGHWRVPDDSLWANRRWLNSIALVYEPRWTPGLYLGFARVYYASIPPDGLQLEDYLVVFQPFLKERLGTPGNPGGEDNRDQMLSLWLRWVFPQVGFEAYVEWGRNDHNWDERDLLLNLDHTRAVIAGLQKIFQNRGGFVRLRAETGNLGNTTSRMTRPAPTWYQHHLTRQGYTQRGQVIGAGLGPGGDGQYLDVDVFRSWGSAGGFISRVRTNDDQYLTRFGSGPSTGFFMGREVALSAGLRGTYVHRFVAVQGELEYTKQYNRYFRNIYIDPQVPLDVGNLGARLLVQWRP